MNWERLLLDRVDEGVQNLVVAFSRQRPSTRMLGAVAGLYLLTAFHLVFAAVVPFHHDAIERTIGVPSAAVPESQLDAFATGIIVGGVSYHLLLAIAYLFFSLAVRANRAWVRILLTTVLAANIAVASNGLRTPHIATMFFVLQWTVLVLAAPTMALVWGAAIEAEGLVATASILPAEARVEMPEAR